MKLKLYPTITNPAKFATGEYDYSISLFAEPLEISGWHVLDPVEVEVPNELVPELHKQALQELDEQERTARANFEQAMRVVDALRDKLLALPHQPGGDA
jgi:hypothetical protein